MNPEVEKNIEIGQRLIRETQTRLKNSLGLSLTYKMQLQDDMRLVKTCIDKIRPDKPNEKKEKALANAVIRLQTTSENILQWKFDADSDENLISQSFREF